ncbi:hypothetical protein [Streptomyces sp. NPDC086787]|uniref:hypothetical protein n=1 Tax=Streptomyces sp. NPDC086787 TaxID=3365759 RepID=UPI00381D0854
MAFLSSRRRRARLVLALDDPALDRLLKALLATTRTGTIATTDLCSAQISRLMDEETDDWDRHTQRMSVLAHCLSETHVPRAWTAREPGNARARVLHAWSLLVRARAQRSLADGNTIAQNCFRAAELAPQDPTPWVVLLGLARLERRGQPEAFGIWNEVLARDRWNREAYLGMLRYLGPDEMGSRIQVLDFVDAVRARAPENAPCTATELTAQVLQYHSVLALGGVEALMARNHWTHVEAAQVLDRAAHTWARPGFLHHAAALADLNLLAYALIAAERRHDARPVFEAIGGQVVSWPWSVGGEPVAEYEKARSRTTIGG